MDSPYILSCPDCKSPISKISRHNGFVVVMCKDCQREGKTERSEEDAITRWNHDPSRYLINKDKETIVFIPPYSTKEPKTDYQAGIEEGFSKFRSEIQQLNPNIKFEIK